MAASVRESRHAGNFGIGDENPEFSKTSQTVASRVSSGVRVGFGAVVLAVVAVAGAALLPGFLRRAGGEAGTVCWRDFRTGSRACRPRCANGTFGLPGMDDCVPWLHCVEIAAVDVGQEIGGGAVKQVHLGFWNNHPVAVATPVTLDNAVLYRSDFESGLGSLEALSPNERLVQLVGFCRDPLALVTEYHQLGSAALTLEHLQHRDSLAARLQLCLDYADILRWLHASGPRVMCDSSSLAKTLQQYLLTDDLRLLLNDVDALPMVTESLIRCGDRPLDGEFVAPEQRWSGQGPMPRYNHKTDIWKIPDVCGHFLAGARDEDLLRFHLFDIHRKCKALAPEQRPTASEVLAVYQDVLERFKT